ncbi:hypothetical protein BJ508DRAFT_342886 [Ascobolus immersus RN42]|uniref:Uncharacterized protein n=1 Tax=Ascobolus immersus RN42 TaxID=1160509 RepID=A0A3N4HSM9_ASCIM|nr:hypothetical protein BJ508DRAFT_342886 [Ascobolus immersus RN42]
MSTTITSPSALPSEDGLMPRAQFIFLLRHAQLFNGASVVNKDDTHYDRLLDDAFLAAENELLGREEEGSEVEEDTYSVVLAAAKRGRQSSPVSSSHARKRVCTARRNALVVLSESTNVTVAGAAPPAAMPSGSTYASAASARSTAPSSSITSIATSSTSVTPAAPHLTTRPSHLPKRLTRAQYDSITTTILRTLVAHANDDVLTHANVVSYVAAAVPADITAYYARIAEERAAMPVAVVGSKVGSRGIKGFVCDAMARFRGRLGYVDGNNRLTEKGKEVAREKGLEVE